MNDRVRASLRTAVQGRLREREDFVSGHLSESALKSLKECLLQHSCEGAYEDFVSGHLSESASKSACLSARVRAPKRVSLNAHV